jgi:hypothetical protein
MAGFCTSEKDNKLKKKVEKWFSALPDEQRNMLTELQQLVLSQHNNFKEEIKWGQPCYSLNKLVCYLAKYKTHVALGFQQGAHLNDPEKLLEGEGKNMRHIKFKASESFNSQLVKSLILEAIKYDAR